MFFSKRFMAAGTELCDFDHHVAAPYMRRSFTLDFVPEAAGVTVCGLGFYELTVNGVPLTKGPLAPYITNPDDVLYYDHYDLAPYLTRGENVIGLLLGNGMRNCFGGFVWDFEKAESRGPVCFALAFSAEGEGKRCFFEADEQFLTHPSPVLLDDLRMGYRYDARRELPGWDKVGFDTSDWTAAIPCPTPKGEARLCMADPVRVVAKHAPVSIRYEEKAAFAHNKLTWDGNEPFPETVREHVYIYDFGINSAGVTVLKINGRPGQTISIRHGEYMHNGCFSTSTTFFQGEDIRERYFEYAQRDVFVCKGGEETFVPRFKFDGFRYAFVEGLDPEQATPDALSFWEMTGGYEERGDFSSSSPILDQLYDMTRRSDRSNFLYFPTDCPHREKNGWTGDASMSAEHMLLHMKGEKNLREWLHCVAAAQNAQGAIPGIVPTGGWGFAWGNGPAWDSVMFFLPYEIYRHTGDKSIITEFAQPMCRYLAYARTKRDERGLCAYGLGDWLDPFQWIDQNGEIAAPLALTDSLMLYSCCKKAAHLFAEAVLEEERRLAESFGAELLTAVRAHLIDYTTMTVAGACQTSQAMALGEGVFTEEERPAAEKRLLALIEKREGENACGMIGLRYLFHVLTGMGEQDLAFRMLTSNKRTGYAFWIDHGATALWENFPVEDGRNVCSQNHHFLGDFSSTMVQEWVGLSPNPTYHDVHSFRIAPHFVSALDYAQASYEGVDGRLFARWERQSANISLHLSIPQGQHGELVCPAGWTTTASADLQPGEYDILFAKA